MDSGAQKHTDGLVPCSREEALMRMQKLVDDKSVTYQLGTGDYLPGDPHQPHFDCAGAAQCYAYRLKRHRPGFANGMVPPQYRDQADVDDDINTNSAIEDALTKRELYEFVEGTPEPGDLIGYPTLRIHGKDGQIHTFIGHVALIEFAPSGWKQGDGYHRLMIYQCCGPNGRSPGVICTDASVFDHHDHLWPKPEHRTVLLRVKAP